MRCTCEQSDSRLGLLQKYGGDTREEAVKKLSPGVVALYQGDDLLTFTKSSRRSRVHRDVYSDYLVVKRFDQNRKPIGECAFSVSTPRSFTPTAHGVFLSCGRRSAG